MPPVFPAPKVIVVSKRLESVCATKALLNSYGFDVATVTTTEAAQAVARATPCRAAIVCYHSFSAAERDQIAATLTHADPKMAVVGRCPGCLGCDEQAGLIGNLPDDEWLSGVILSAHSEHSW